MNRKGIKALTFDTGGTVLDWHTGFRDAFAAAGRRHGVGRDWAALANDLRRRTMASMLNLGGDGQIGDERSDPQGQRGIAVVERHQIGLPSRSRPCKRRAVLRGKAEHRNRGCA